MTIVQDLYCSSPRDDSTESTHIKHNTTSSQLWVRPPAEDMRNISNQSEASTTNHISELNRVQYLLYEIPHQI
jgi:hypothetical protein